MNLLPFGRTSSPNIVMHSVQVTLNIATQHLSAEFVNGESVEHRDGVNTENKKIYYVWKRNANKTWRKTHREVISLFLMLATKAYWAERT